MGGGGRVSSSWDRPLRSAAERAQRLRRKSVLPVWSQVWQRDQRLWPASVVTKWGHGTPLCEATGNRRGGRSVPAQGASLGGTR